MNSNKTYLLSTANAIYNNGVEKWGCRIECADSCQQSSLLNESWEAWHYISADGYYFFEISPNGSWFPISEPTTLYLKTVVILSDEKDPHGYATESVYEVNADPYSVKSGTSWSTIQSTNIVEPTGRYAGTTFTWNTDWTITFLYN